MYPKQLDWREFRILQVFRVFKYLLEKWKILQTVFHGKSELGSSSKLSDRSQEDTEKSDTDNGMGIISSQNQPHKIMKNHSSLITTFQYIILCNHFFLFTYYSLQLMGILFIISILTSTILFLFREEARSFYLV